AVRQRLHGAPFEVVDVKPALLVGADYQASLRICRVDPDCGVVCRIAEGCDGFCLDGWPHHGGCAGCAAPTRIPRVQSERVGKAVPRHELEIARTVALVFVGDRKESLRVRAERGARCGDALGFRKSLNRYRDDCLQVRQAVYGEAAFTDVGRDQPGSAITVVDGDTLDVVAQGSPGRAQVDRLAHRVALGFRAESPDAHAFFADVEHTGPVIDGAEARVLAGRYRTEELSGDAVSSREQFVLICEATVRRGEKIVTAG